MVTKNKIVVTGGSGRFAQSLKKTKCKYKFIYPTKTQLNITNLKSIRKYLKIPKPQSVLHLAGLSRPMIQHEKCINRSINLNIIGTANLVNICSELKIKLIYFSTSYVYPGTKGNYKEIAPIFPINNYAWSKLGGECAVTMYKNSLILRITMCEKPFLHKYAFNDIKTNFIFQEEVAKVIPKILDKKGILNIGGKIQSVYDFAKKNKKNVKKASGKNKFPPNPSMNISKLKKIMKW